MSHPRVSFAIIAGGALIAALAAPAARAGEKGRIHVFGHDYSILVGATTFVPRSANTRSVYGSTKVTPAVTVWSFDTPRGLGLSWDLGTRNVARGDHRADFVRGGVGPRILFADNRSDVAPYLTVRGDAYMLRLDNASWRTRPGANVEIGASVMRHVVVAGRYDEVPRIGGVDLSGFSARALVKVF